jgi:hypothetical protein
MTGSGCRSSGHGQAKPIEGKRKSSSPRPSLAFKDAFPLVFITTTLAHTWETSSQSYQEWEWVSTAAQRRGGDLTVPCSHDCFRLLPLALPPFSLRPSSDLLRSSVEHHQEEGLDRILYGRVRRPHLLEPHGELRFPPPFLSYTSCVLPTTLQARLDKAN